MKHPTNKYFFLGGLDLEMYEIENLVLQCGCVCYNASLKWDNAFLSNYSQELKRHSEKPGNIIYGVELKEDIPVPDNYVKIDHHNEYSNRRSSLEQVAEILNVDLTRYQKLVAANDVGYIPAMLNMGATIEEIESIRTADRCAQGVSAEDESLAEQAIQENLTQVKDLIVVHAFSSTFSPICDRLYPYEALLIYTESEFTYYGNRVKDLKEMFSAEILQRKIYYGGNDGYCGAASGCYTQEEIINLVTKIKKLYETI